MLKILLKGGLRMITKSEDFLISLLHNWLSIIF